MSVAMVFIHITHVTIEEVTRESLVVTILGSFIIILPEASDHCHWARELYTVETFNSRFSDLITLLIKNPVVNSKIGYSLILDHLTFV